MKQIKVTKKIKTLLFIILLVLTAGAMVGFTSRLQVVRAEEVSKNFESDSKFMNVFSYKDVLFKYYIDFAEHYESLDSVGDVPSFEEFHDAFYTQDTFEIYEFTEYLKQLAAQSNNFDVKEIENEPMRGSGNPVFDPVRNNIGTGPLSQRPDYGNFALFDFKPGDILYEEVGFSTGTDGISGHMGLIEGRFKDSLLLETYRIACSQ